jgi:hypothetical protein
MQHYWTASQPDIFIETSTSQKALTPCEFCFEPSNPVILTDIFSASRDRQCSEPVKVPDSLVASLLDGEQQPHPSQSSGYESPYGNELSPTANYWSLGLFFSFKYHSFFY